MEYGHTLYFVLFCCICIHLSAIKLMAAYLLLLVPTLFPLQLCKAGKAESLWPWFMAKWETLQAFLANQSFQKSPVYKRGMLLLQVWFKKTRMWPNIASQSHACIVRRKKKWCQVLHCKELPECRHCCQQPRWSTISPLALTVSLKETPSKGKSENLTPFFIS